VPGALPDLEFSNAWAKYVPTRAGDIWVGNTGFPPRQRIPCRVLPDAPPEGNLAFSDGRVPWRSGGLFMQDRSEDSRIRRQEVAKKHGEDPRGPPRNQPVYSWPPQCGSARQGYVGSRQQTLAGCRSHYLRAMSAVLKVKRTGVVCPARTRTCCRVVRGLPSRTTEAWRV
jgi:hypothetical protein